MRILGKGKDYYDSGCIYYDDELLFLRERFFFDKQQHPISSTPAPDAGNYKISCGVIGFCDKYHPNIRVVEFEKIINIDGHQTGWKIKKQNFYYNAEEVHQLVLSLPKVFSDLLLSKLRRKLKMNFDKSIFGFDLNKATIEFFKTTNYNLFDQHFEDAPYFAIGYSSFDSDAKFDDPRWHSEATGLPILTEFKFQKVMPPMQAYQEISMFLGRKNTEQGDPNAGIQDKYLAAGKGFDCKSFRTRAPKSGRKARKAQRKKQQSCKKGHI